MSDAREMVYLAERQSKSTQHELARAAVTAQLSTTLAILELAATVQRVGVLSNKALDTINGTLWNVVAENVDDTEADDHSCLETPDCPVCKVPVDQPVPAGPRCDAALIGPDVGDIPCVLVADHSGLHSSLGNSVQWND